MTDANSLGVSGSFKASGWAATLTQAVFCRSVLKALIWKIIIRSYQKGRYLWVKGRIQEFGVQTLTSCVLCAVLYTCSAEPLHTLGSWVAPL